MASEVQKKMSTELEKFKALQTGHFMSNCFMNTLSFIQLLIKIGKRCFKCFIYHHYYLLYQNLPRKHMTTWTDICLYELMEASKDIRIYHECPYRIGKSFFLLEVSSVQERLCGFSFSSCCFKWSQIRQDSSIYWCPAGLSPWMHTLPSIYKWPTWPGQVQS